MISVEVAPSHSLVLVMDPSVGRIPEKMSGALVAATTTCVAIGTLSEHDGTTRICLGTEEYSGGGNGVFDGELDTPGGRVAVCSVLDEVLLEVPVPFRRSRVRIWANDDQEPSELNIRVTKPSGIEP